MFNSFRPFFISFSLIFIIGLSTNAQERLGIVGSNFGGSQNAMINPSNILNSKLYMDINLVGFGLSFQNNYLYIPKKEYSFGKFLRNINDYLKNDNGTQSPVDFHETNYKKGSDVNANSNITANGLSAMYAINDQAFGFYSSFRHYTHVKNIPYDQANFVHLGFDIQDQLNAQYSKSNYGAASATWLELGFTYARVLNKSYNKHLSGGITIKRLLSFAGAYYNADKISYKIDLDANAIVEESDFSLGYAFPIDYQTNEYIDELKVLGKGWAFDLGFTFQLKQKGFEIKKHRRSCEIEFEPYILKLGVSLLDIGKISYNEKARAHHYAGSIVWESIDTAEFRNVNQITQELSMRYYGDPNTSLSDTVFSIGLPTTFSLQADYHYNKKLYVGGLFMMPIKIQNNQLRRPAILALIPRYETPKFEASLPLSLFDFYKMRLGLSLRYSFLTLGTDKLGAFFGLSNFDGFDIYCMIKFNFHKGKCSNKYIKTCI